jgi:hypothetical protein
MHPSAPGYKRDLDDLYQLAGELFDALRETYSTRATLAIRLDEIDLLVDTVIDEEHLVATTLLCAQLLRRVTAEPARTQPRQVVTLGDIIDQTLTTLLHDDRPDSSVRRQLRDIHERVCGICMSLALLADPGSSGSFNETI